MRTTTLLIVVCVLACAGCKATPQTASDKAPKPGQETPPAAAPATERCGDSSAYDEGDVGADVICTAPERCTAISPNLPGSPTVMECWIPCPESGTCADGKECHMVHDGPGQTCGQVDDG